MNISFLHQYILYTRFTSHTASDYLPMADNQQQSTVADRIKRNVREFGTWMRTVLTNNEMIAVRTYWEERRRGSCWCLEPPGHANKRDISIGWRAPLITALNTVIGRRAIFDRCMATQMPPPGDEEHLFTLANRWNKDEAEIHGEFIAWNERELDEPRRTRICNYLKNMLLDQQMSLPCYEFNIMNLPVTWIDHLPPDPPLIPPPELPPLQWSDSRIAKRAVAIDKPVTTRHIGRERRKLSIRIWDCNNMPCRSHRTLYQPIPRGGSDRRYVACTRDNFNDNKKTH
jgi:hypothetical protein